MSADPSTRPVIALHGWTMCGAVFDDLNARLGGRVIAPDMPGHGTDASAPEHPIEACVDRLDQVIRDLGRDDAILLGWSMGAVVAWDWLSRQSRPGIATLVTVDMSPKPVNSPDWSLGLNGQTPARMAANVTEVRNDWPRAAEKIATTMFASKAGAPGLSRDAALRQILSNDPVVMARYWEALLALDLRAAARAVSIPWVVAHGAHSRVYPAETATWLADLPNARRISFEHSGHSPHLEEPQAFADMLMAL